MLKDRKYIILDDLGLPEQDRDNILQAFNINPSIKIKQDIVDINGVHITDDYINTSYSKSYGIDLQCRGAIDECVESFRHKLEDIIKQITKDNNLTVEESINFNIYVQSSGYDSFEECADVTYEVVESRHEYEMRQLKIKALPSVLKAREAYAKIIQDKEEQKKLKEKESFEKELLELKKKYKID